MIKPKVFSNQTNYNSYYSVDIKDMVEKFCIEVHGSKPTDKFSIKRFINEHDYIVMAMDDSTPIGFFSCVLLDNSGLTNQDVVVDSMYIDTDYRKSKAFAVLMGNIIQIANKHKCGFSLATFNQELVLMANKFKKDKSYEVISFSHDSVVSEYNKFKRITER